MQRPERLDELPEYWRRLAEQWVIEPESPEDGAAQALRRCADDLEAIMQGNDFAWRH